MNWKHYMPLCLLLAFLSACYYPAGNTERQVSLRPTVQGSCLTKAIVPDVSALKEDDLSGGLDVYVSGHGVFRKYQIGSPVSGGVFFLSSQWKEAGFQVGLDYDVYVVANPDDSLLHAAGLDEIEAMAAAPDADIYRLYDPQAASFDLAKTRSKQFVMGGHTVWRPADVLEQTIDITLDRLAVKIQVDFSLDSALSGYHFYGTPQWKLMNYAVAAPLFDSLPLSPVPTRTTPLLMDVSSHSATGGTITTYCYPRVWNDDEPPTAIILNVPLQDSLTSVVLNSNYYLIPLTDLSPGSFHVLERNTFYRTEVTLQSLGSSGETATDQSIGLHCQVLPWAYDGIVDNVNVVGREIEYLMVDPTTDELREKVLSGSFQPRTRSLNFWASGQVVCSAPEVYYYDKTDTRVNASALSPVTVSVSGDRNGTIDVTSVALANNTVKYIRFRASLADNPLIFEDILIRHYPLDHIQNLEGLWSSLTTSGWVNWDTDQTAHYPARTVSNSIFPAKVFYNGGIYYIQESRSGWRYTATRGQRITGISNNRMYVVQITSTSDDYTVGRVTLDAGHQSQDHLVSPAFMIASQLGATQICSNGQDAASHSATYKEVTADGRVFDGWRLPTREEIGIIMSYQYSSDAIDEVLSGSHYWTLEGRCVSRTNHTDPAADASSGYIRCVRDLSASEVALLNEKD